MKGIYIVKRILENKTISDEAFCVWAALQPFSNIQMDLLLSIPYIGYLIYGRETTRTEADAVRAGFDELVQSGTIVVSHSLKKNEYVCNIQNLYFKQGSEYFVQVSYDELHKIMNIQTRANRSKLFRYFVSVVGCFNYSNNVDEEYRGRVCGISLESINALIPKKTAIHYNEILEENEILFVYRSDDILYSEKQGLKRIANAYSRYADKNLCLTFAMQYQNNYGWKKRQSDLDKANTSRSLAQKYNNMLKGKEYDPETVRDIYVWAVEWNQARKKQYDHEISVGNHVELIQKDMTIFEKYGNLKGDNTNEEKRKGIH